MDNAEAIVEKTYQLTCDHMYLSFLAQHVMSVTFVCLSVCLSVTLVDCDHTVQLSLSLSLFSLLL